MRNVRVRVSDVRLEDRISFRRFQWQARSSSGRVFRIRSTRDGYREFTIASGGEELTKEYAIENMIWMEIE